MYPIVGDGDLGHSLLCLPNLGGQLEGAVIMDLRRVAGMLLALTGPMLVLGQASPAAAASGVQDCNGQGTIAVVANARPQMGYIATVKQDGPAGQSWSRHVLRKLGVYTASNWAFISPYASGGWGANPEVTDSTFSAHAECSYGPASDWPLRATHKYGAHSCPKGENVMLNAIGEYRLMFYWDNTDKPARRLKMGLTVGGGSSNIVDTGRQSIDSGRVESHVPNGPQPDGGYITDAWASCSGGTTAGD